MNKTSIAQALNKASVTSCQFTPGADVTDGNGNVVGSIPATGLGYDANETPKVKAKRVRKLPAGTMAKLVVAKGTSFFDPIDLLEDHLGMQPTLHSRVLDSMAWMLDSSCISQARTILFERYKEVDHDAPDAFNDFCQDVAENLDHESLYGDEAQGSPEQTLAILLALRDQWHDAAARAASADNRDYKSKSLRQLMEEEKPQAANIGTRVNYKKLAELEARGDSAKQERLYAAYMEADALSSAQRVIGNKTLMPTILELLRTAQRYALDVSRFDHLPLTVQRRLATFTIGAIDRSKLEVAKRLSKQPIAFGHVAEAAFQATEALNLVIINKYSDDGELENIRSKVETEIEARAHRKACCTID